MIKILSILLMVFLFVPKILAYEVSLYGPYREYEYKIAHLGTNLCSEYVEQDIPTILVPGIMASWYSEQGFKDNKIKRWEIDPITKSYDPFINLFKDNGYNIKKINYLNEYEIDISGNPKNSLYLFGYDWKKDNKISAKILANLVNKIAIDYEKYNSCKLNKVNIVGHSMGGLIVRAMLEDMCISDSELKKYKKGYLTNKGSIATITSSKCNLNSNINKFVTISTPHRGSPKTLPIWEKGDFEMVESLFTTFPLKLQFNNISKLGMYKIVHAYDDKIKNGIVTIGQLLPDISNTNNINYSLEYLNKLSVKIPKKAYPKNTFLEELNKEKNIDKMWSKIEKKYISFYTTITGNTAKNNIVSFNLDDGKKIISKRKNDITEVLIGKNIYDDYDDKIIKNNYNIEKINRDSTGLGGDGTVPTLNLLLIANDNNDSREVKNSKFESIELKCYDDKKKKQFGTKNLSIIENNKYDYFHKKYNIFPEQELIACNHGNTPTISAKNIYKFLTGIESKGDIEYEKVGSYESLKNIVRYDILSPINIVIEDEKGRKIGINPDTGLIENNIPGAWTSGNTHGSPEGEFFIIPLTATGKLNHKISTYSTGNGSYHIVAKDLKGNNLVIGGNAKIALGEDYNIRLDNDKMTYNTLGNQKLKIDFNKNNYISYDSKLNLNYILRGSGSENVSSLKYLLKKDDTIVGREFLDITGSIGLDFYGIGKYDLEIELYNKNKKLLLTKKLIINKLQKKVESIYKIEDNGNMIFNKSDSNLKYYLGNNKKLYSIIDNKVYFIDLIHKKRYFQFKNSNFIEKIFVNEKGEIYIYDGIIKKYDKLNNKLINILKIDNMKSFIVIDNNIYYLDYTGLGYREYNVNNKEIIKYLGDKNIDFLIMKNGNLKIYEKKLNNFSYLEYNPEFDIVYENHLKIIKKRLDNKGLSDQDKTKLIEKINLSKQKFLNLIKNKYKREVYKYFIDNILLILSS